MNPPNTSLTVHRSPANSCYRLQWDSSGIKSYYLGTGVLQTTSNLFCGTDSECRAKMTELGFAPVTAPFHAPPPAPPVAISKLALRRKLRELGLEATMDTFLAADATRQKDYNDAQCLFISDPLLAAAIPAFATLAGKTTEEITALLLECR